MTKKKQITIRRNGGVSKFTPWPTTARRIQDKSGKWVYSHNASITTKDAPDVWAATTLPNADPTRLLTTIYSRKVDGVEQCYMRHHLSAQGIGAVQAYLNSITPFTITQRVDYGNGDKGHIWDELTGTGSKDATQAPIWGYNLFNIPNRYKKVDTYQGVGFRKRIYLAINSLGKENTPCVPSKDEVTQFLPCGLPDQKLLFGLRPSKRYMKQQSALNLLFVSRPLRPCEQIKNALSLNTNENDDTNTDWIPTTGNPLDVMMFGEDYAERQLKAAEALDAIKGLIGDDKYQMLVMSAEGHSNSTIAEELGKSTEAVKKALQRIRKQIKGEVN